MLSSSSVKDEQLPVSCREKDVNGFDLGFTIKANWHVSQIRKQLKYYSTYNVYRDIQRGTNKFSLNNSDQLALVHVHVYDHKRKTLSSCVASSTGWPHSLSSTIYNI